MKVFGIFQGGGAQGISHIGACHAVRRELGAQFVGVAGASAGALVAALLAVGYEPHELVDVQARADDPERDALSRLGQSPIDILGRADWRRFQVLLHLLRHWQRYAAAYVLVVAVLLGLFMLGFARGLLTSTAAHGVDGLWAGLVQGSPWLGTLVALNALLGLLYLLGARPVLRARGVFDPRQVQNVMEQLLQAKVRRTYAAQGLGEPPPQIRFCDIDPWQPHLSACGFIELKVVVTDLSQGKLRLFGMDHHPEASIAEVVAASISLPFVFKPARIPSVPELADREFVDGGLLSNLPVWSFRREKRYHERRSQPHAPVPQWAFELKNTPGAVGPGTTERLLDHASRVFKTGIFGSQAITHSFMTDLTVVPIQSPMNLLEFDVRWERAQAAHAAGVKACAVLIEQARARQELAHLLEDLHATAHRLLAEQWLTPWQGRLRLMVFTRSGRTSFKVRHSHNLGHDTDDRIVIDVDSPGVPMAHATRSPVGLLRDPALHRVEHCAQIPMSKYDFAHLWPQWQATVCIPLFAQPTDIQKPAHERAEPIAVLGIDSNEDIVDTLLSDAALPSIVREAIRLTSYLLPIEEP